MVRNLKGLEEHRKAQSKEKKEAAMSAIKELLSLNEVVNINAVSEKANVSRRYIYNNPDLIKLIEEAKGPSLIRNQKKITSFKASAKSNDAQLRLIKERYQKVLKENKALKDEIKTLQLYIEQIE
jgi:hypothetical protein